MAERQRAHIALCREHNTIRAHKDQTKNSRGCVHQYKSPHENVLENVIPQGKSLTDIILQMRYGWGGKKTSFYTHLPYYRWCSKGCGDVMPLWPFSLLHFDIFAMHFEEIHFHFVLVSILSVGNTAKAPNGSHSIPPVCDWPALTSLRH